MKKLIPLALAIVALSFGSCNGWRLGGNSAPDTIPDSIVRVNTLIELPLNLNKIVFSDLYDLVNNSAEMTGAQHITLYKSMTNPEMFMIYADWLGHQYKQAQEQAGFYESIMRRVKKYISPKNDVFQAGRPLAFKSCEADSQFIRINCPMEADKDSTGRVLSLARELVEYSQQDSGVVHYDIYRDMYDTTRMMIVETWRSQEVLDMHSAAPHFKRLVPQLHQACDMKAEIFKK